MIWFDYCIIRHIIIMEHLVIDVSPMTKKGICIIEDMDDS